ncbi:hypothetical protein FocTR4_00000146 [Fusarium oxysporum f. sp. cubense]|uniref:DUF7924 domain-containing protein n=1 Tax=Fusarium oxysporum f. sp. cubense TaxID=61366 RepID=A0A5C6SYZ1_FUSOC|nr:hypothetical protein FocTR4_00000146 [Fusarium oxysporum f. sp. cubense]
MPPNQREIQRQLMKKYNIIFDGPIDSITNPHWPSNCNTIFDHIRRLGKTDYSEYRESISADFTRFPWRHQAQQRAKRITKIAKRCLESRKNESGWRLALELEVMARFSVEIACRNCRGRLWRSEPEQGISPLFDDRAEEAIIYSSELRAELPKREHRPDRVFGLQVTERLSRLLNYAEDIRSSPFRLDGDPLVYPFLVIEAKSEKGSDAFTDTQVQTAFAIRELLSIQQELAHVANENEEWDGGPLVWFLSYKGEQWRVFAAYIHTTPDKISYRVVRLWSGGVDSLDGALQLLLIIDYIADWARDIYREGIARSLQRLAPTDSESLRRDDDIFSMAGNIRSWIASNFDRSHDAKDRPMGDSLCKFDCGSGVFRDARFVESQCIGLVITHHNVESFLRTATTDRETRGLISVLLESLERPCLAKGQVLNDLELMWTDTDRNLSEILHPEDVFYVVVVATFYLSPGWKPTRELTYLAVSKKLVQDSIRSPEGPLSSTIQLEKAPMVEDLESFRGLLHMSAEDNLNACLYNFCLRTDKPTRARRSEVNYVWKALPTVASDDADRELQDRVLRACARPSTRDFLASPEDLQLRLDVLDQTEWPWADDSSFKTMKESNKELIIVRRAAQVTYFQADMCIYVLDTSLAQRGIPQALFSCPPETHVLMFKFDEDPSNIGRWGTSSYPEDEFRKGWNLAIHTSDDIGRLMDHFEKLKKELRQYRGFGLLSKWKHVTTGWAKDQNTGSLDFPSNRPFIRHSYQAPLSSTLLKEEDYGSDRLSPMPFHSGVKQANEVTRTAGSVNRTAASVHRPTRKRIVQNLDNTRDGDDRAKSSTMSEQRKGKRPMGAADEPDEAESSAHAERRARQEREVAQRFNSDFLSDEELEELLAKGTLS